MATISAEELETLRRKAEAYDRIVAKNSTAGKASSARMSPQERRERAQKAAAARWAK